MAYTILKPDGSTLVYLEDNVVDRSSSSITLVGKNVNSYGSYLNNNLIKLLCNFANINSNPPANPLIGQLWFNTSTNRLEVYNGQFTPVSGAIVSGSKPANLIDGDLWFDSNNNQLSIHNGNTTFNIGPAYSSLTGEIGWVLPVSPIKDSVNNIQNVSLLRNYGTTVGVMSGSKFKVSTAMSGTENDSTKYFNTSSMNVVAGLTILGDIAYTGQITSKYLSMTVDINALVTSGSNVTVKSEVDQLQNPAIIDLLVKMYPPSDNTLVKLVSEAGVPLGTQARVLCKFISPTVGYQVRRFIVNNTLGRPQWDIMITTATNTITATYPPVANLVW